MVGDVILTLFPYTDLSNAKLRPAVVLAEVGMGDRVLCEIISSLQNGLNTSRSPSRTCVLEGCGGRVGCVQTEFLH